MKKLSGSVKSVILLVLGLIFRLFIKPLLKPLAKSVRGLDVILQKRLSTLKEELKEEYEGLGDFSKEKKE